MDHTSISGKGSLCVFSYNSRGFTEDKQDICKMLFANTDEYYPIICNQENFLLKGNGYKVSQCLKDARIIFKQATKESFDGRPKNGMFIAVPGELKAYVKDVSPHHARVQAIVLSMKTKILIVNSYFPTDPKTADFDTTELWSTLSSIESVMKENDYDNVVWCGDINADFVRNTSFTTTIDRFVKDNSLKGAWENFPVDFTHTFEMDDRTYTSTLDHFFWNERLTSYIMEADVLHLPGNTSDHCPVYCKLEIEKMDIKETTQQIPQAKAPSWKRATPDQKMGFVVELEEKLNSITVPLSSRCKNVHCNDPEHVHEADSYMVEILESIKDAAAQCLPGNSKAKVKPGRSPIMDWKKQVQPFRDNAMFWHAVWISAGRPINTAVHQVMKRTRNIYHYQIRKSRRMTECIRKNTLLDACINNNGDIFKEIRKLRRTSPTVSSVIDGNNSNIESHFADVYKKLYNSVDDAESLSRIHRRLNDSINEGSLVQVNKITPQLIQLAISKLKNDKTDPVFQFTSDCLKNAPRILTEHFAAMFKMMLIHGHISSMILLSTVIPLIKDKLGDVTSSNNYRSIALSSLILKIFDWVVLLLFDENLSTDQLQFGYQEKTSTNMCTWAAVETIDHYVRNGSEVFVGVMDMTKAFDNVKQSLLFEKLIDRNVPPVFLRLILKMYRDQKASVCWNGSISGTFGIRNGVKQGGVLSARLFCVYIDDLFGLLRKKKSGCWMKGHFVGVLGYADDLLLLAPSRDALQEMIRGCEHHAKELNISFSTNDNPKKCKTKCMAILKKDREIKNITLGGKQLPWVTSAKHLGCKLTNTAGALTDDLMEKRAVFINKVNELNQEFHFAHPTTKIGVNNIFNSYFYGSTLWDLFGKEATRLEKSWNIAQRIMLGLPRNAHRYVIEPLSDTPHIMHSLFKRYIKFINAVRTSRKMVLRVIFQTTYDDCRSNTGANLRHMMKLTRKSRIVEMKQSDFDKLTYNKIPEGEDWRIASAAELIQLKNNVLDVDFMTIQEIDAILEEVVT